MNTDGLSTGSEVDAAVVDRYDGLLVDLDGVVYRGDRAVEPAVRTIEEIRRRGCRLLYLTNNSSRTTAEVAEKLRSMGVATRADEVMTSAEATAAMLAREAREGGTRPRTAFVVGERGIREALAGIGVELLGGDPDESDLVVVGFDSSADYAKLRRAALLVERGARLVGTNPDSSYPAPDGLWPGAGALLAVVTTTTGAVPTIVGKPAPPLFEAAAERLAASRPLVVGDRLDTDIAGAAALGWDSMLVLSGAATPRDLLLHAAPLPTYVRPDLSAVLEDVPPTVARSATTEDRRVVKELLEASGLSSNDLENRLDSTLVSFDDRGLLATACVATVDADGAVGILRSVAVAERVRGRGVGMLVVAAAVRRAREHDVSRVFLMTETARPFFARLGFRPLTRAELPSDVRNSADLESCSSDAVAMSLSLELPSDRRALRRQ